MLSTLFLLQLWLVLGVFLVIVSVAKMGIYLIYVLGELITGNLISGQEAVWVFIWLAFPGRLHSLAKDEVTCCFNAGGTGALLLPL